MTAKISGTASANTITGTISNMEDWNPRGYWEDSAIMPDDISFGADSMIDVKEDFTGTFASYPAGYDHGGYRSRFYRLHDGLETAGVWIMAPPTSSVGNPGSTQAGSTAQQKPIQQTRPHLRGR